MELNVAVVRLENISRGCFIYLYFVVSCGRRAGDRESRHLTWSAVSNRSNDWAADWLHIIPRFHFFSYPFLLLCVCVSVCSILGVGLEVIAVAAVSAIALILRKAGVNWMKGKPLDAVGLFRRPPPLSSTSSSSSSSSSSLSPADEGHDITDSSFGLLRPPPRPSVR